MGRKDLYMLPLMMMLCACDGVFDTHPYDVNVHGERGINQKNITRIEEQCAENDTLRIAFFSDTHGWYSDTRDIIDDINRHEELDFVVHCGDLTDTGTVTEYEWIRKLLGRLSKPYVALIGNHDFLGTGDQTYQQMFGEKDFSFIAGHIKFVCLNTNATEYDYLAAVPNFDFMETEMTAESDRFDRTIILMHARPFCEQFNNNVAKAFDRYINLFPNLMFCVSAHDHTIQEDDLYGDGIMFYGIDCAEHRNYHLFTITKGGYTHEIVRL